MSKSMRTFRPSSSPMVVAGAICLVVGSAAIARADEPKAESKLPRVLLLGDSISIGYTQVVQQALKDEAVVHRPMRGRRPENCAGTNNGVQHIDRWLKIDGGNWDVIHFNFGLHDLKRVLPETGKNSNDPKHPRQAEPDRYVKQLSEIVAKLKQTGAELIFATTTPVPPGGVKPHRDVDDPARYNALAAKVAAQHGVAINDLYELANKQLYKIQRPVNVHFTREGSKLLAGQVVQHIRAALKRHGGGKSARRPNILWLIVEDMSAHFGCYGETTVKTPVVDRLAAEGLRFRRAFITAPVCSAARSALITGMYQTSIGAHQHRSGRGTEKIRLPDGVRLVPALFRDAGYYTVNSAMTNRGNRIAKTDYNFEWDASAYDGNDWSKRKPGQPFFAQIQLRGGKLRGGANWPDRVKQTLGGVTDKSDVKLPPYYPDDPVIRDDWARYLDAVRYTDWEVGQILKRLDREGIADNTYIFFITDHGISHARGKQFCYDEGIHIPLIIRGPGLAATSLGLAGIPVPGGMESRDLLAADYQPRPFVVSARDRCDETVDRIRSVRTSRYKYIRNFYPQRPYLQPNAYKDHKAILIRMRELYAAHKLNAAQAKIMADSRPAEELYDLEVDPHELNNLAGEPSSQATLRQMRRQLDEWIKASGDHGVRPEAAAMFDSDMKVYLDAIGRRFPERGAIIQANINQMKAWAAAGK